MRPIYIPFIVAFGSGAIAQNFENALYFDAPEQYMRVDYDYPTDHVFLELWFRADTFNGAGMVSCSAYGFGTPENRDSNYYLQVNQDSLLRFRVRPSFPSLTWLLLEGTTKLEPGSWHHVYCAWSDQDKYELWLDGQLEASDNGHAYSSIHKNLSTPPLLTIGTTLEDGLSDPCFRGAIDEVRIWDSYRDSIWINDHMHDTLPPSIYNDPNSGITGYWRMDMMEDLGVNSDGADDIRDETQNARHGDTWGGLTLQSSYDPTGINEIFDVPEVKIWPNPFSDELFIELDQDHAKRAHIEVVDMLGRTISTRGIGYVNEAMNITSMFDQVTQRGSYIIRVCVDDKCSNSRVMKF